MSIAREQVKAEVLNLLSAASDDWEYSGTITPETGLLGDLGFESLELVILGVSIQEHFKRTMPFPEYLAGLGEQQAKDVYVGDLIEFTYQHVAQADGAEG